MFEDDLVPSRWKTTIILPVDLSVPKPQLKFYDDMAYLQLTFFVKAALGVILHVLRTDVLYTCIAEPTRTYIISMGNDLPPACSVMSLFSIFFI